MQALSIPGGPDLLVGWRYAANLLVEVKTGKAKLRPGQRQWHAAWRGAPVWTLRSVEDAQALIRTLRGR